ncbi:MAG: hypothetical protein ACM31O_03370 [Bacteroidota bacterium]
MSLPLSTIVSCVRRELARRKEVYPSEIIKGRMSKETAAQEIAAMQAALTELERRYAIDRAALPIARAAAGMALRHEGFKAQVGDEHLAWALAAYSVIWRISPAQWGDLVKAVDEARWTDQQ